MPKRELLSAELLVTVILVCSAVFAITHGAHIEGNTRIWTDKANYAPRETVTIFGSTFRANAKITLSVTWPNSQVDSLSDVVSDSAGSFEAFYHLVGMDGTFNVTATDGTNTATTTFTDAPISITISISPTSVATGSTTSFHIYVTDAITEAGSMTISMPSVSGASWGTPSSVSENVTNWIVNSTAAGYLSIKATTPGSPPFDVNYLKPGNTMNVTFTVVAPSATGTSTWAVNASDDASFSQSGSHKDIKTQDVSITSPGYSVTFDALVSGSPFSDATSTATVLTATVGGTPYTVTRQELPKTFSNIAGGTQISYAYSSSINSTVDGKRYGWSSTSGTGSGSDQTGQTGSFSVTADSTVTAAYNVQFYITVTSDHGSPTEASQWVDKGLSFTVSVTNPDVVVSGQHQWSLVGLSLDGSAQALADSLTINDVESAHTIVFSWTGQFYITVDNGGHGTPSQGSQWVDAGAVFSTSVVSPDVVSGDHQWVTSESTLTIDDVDSAQTLTFSWTEQFYITVTSDHGGPTASTWVDAGAVFVASVTSPDVVGAGDRFVCAGHRIDSGSLISGTAHIFTSVDAAHVIEFDWTEQFYLTVNTSPSGVGSPGGAGWYDTGVAAYAALSSGTVFGGSGTQYIFTGWGGDASGTALTSDAIAMTAPKVATANWQTQYYLTVSSLYGSPTGQGWYNASSSASFAVTTPAYGGTDTRYVFTSWSGLGSASYNGTSNSYSVTMNNPISETANWQTQYLVTFDQSGIGSDFTGDVVAVDGVYYARTGCAIWYDSGANISFSYGSPLVVTANVKRYVLTGVDAFSPYTVSSSANVTGTYRTEYQVSFVVNPVGGGTTTPSGTDLWEPTVALPISATPTSGYGFTSWTVTGPITVANSSSSSTTATIGGPGTITASFTSSGVDIWSPVTTKTLTGSLGLNNWYTSNVKVTLRATDNVGGSGVKEIHYILDGGAGAFANGDSASITVIGDGTHTLTYWAVDNAGNIEAHSSTVIKIDMTVPIVSITAPTNGASYQNGTVPVAACIITEANTYTMVESGYSATLGVHTYTVTATDEAGNIGSASVTYTVYNTVTFTETGLPDGTSWSVTFNDATQSSITDTITFAGIFSGDYSWNVSTPISAGTEARHIASTSSGTMPVPTETSKTITYTAQYYLAVNSPYGTADGSGWYDSGASTSATVDRLTVAGIGVQYIFTGWSDDASGATSPSNAITMTGPKTATAMWKTQYYLNVISLYGSVTPKAGWFDSGTLVSASVGTPVTVSLGTKYVCTGWTGTGSVPASGTATNVFFTLDQPSSIAWNWKMENPTTDLPLITVTIVAIFIALIALAVYLLLRRMKRARTLSSFLKR